MMDGRQEKTSSLTSQRSSALSFLSKHSPPLSPSTMSGKGAKGLAGKGAKVRCPRWRGRAGGRSVGFGAAGRRRGRARRHVSRRRSLARVVLHGPAWPGRWPAASRPLHPPKPLTSTIIPLNLPLPSARTGHPGRGQGRPLQEGGLQVCQGRPAVPRRPCAPPAQGMSTGSREACALSGGGLELRGAGGRRPETAACKGLGGHAPQWRTRARHASGEGWMPSAPARFSHHVLPCRLVHLLSVAAGGLRLV
jgi:hypothetical protein